jgi:PEGA domain
MGKLESPLKALRRCTWEAGVLLLVVCVAPARSRGQAVIEAAGADSSSAGAATAVTKELPTSLPHLGTESSSAYILTREGPPPDETNRRSLEQRAGKDAAKVLLQSVPSEAGIHIDGMFVGRTPLLLILPPGKYKVEMRGKREEFGERLMDLSPNETQQLSLTLALRYPARISAEPRGALPPAGATTAGTKMFPASSLPHPGTGSSPASLAAREGPPPDETNRRDLEKRAGKDAAKLLLQSVPSEALTYIDGTFVGRTPLLLIVPPGKHNVEMLGKREEFGERLVGLLPKETQQLTLTLALRYPARTSAR